MGENRNSTYYNLWDEVKQYLQEIYSFIYFYDYFLFKFN